VTVELPSSFHWTYDAKGGFQAKKLEGRGQCLVPSPEFARKGPKSSARSRYFKDYASLRQLVLRFCDVTDTKSALAFVNEFGPLTAIGRQKGEEAFEIWNFARRMNKLVRLAAKKEEDEKREEDDRDEGLMDEIGEEGWHFGSLNLSVEAHPVSKRPVLRASPNALKDAIGLTVARMISEKQATVRVCRQCGKIFEVGPGTGRTRRAEFCSDTHRDDFHNQIQKENRNG
jgi:hypothetical protein